MYERGWSLERSDVVSRFGAIARAPRKMTTLRTREKSRLFFALYININGTNYG